MTRRHVALALVPAIIAFALILTALASEIAGGDWSRAFWIGIPAPVGFPILSALLAAPVFVIALAVLVVWSRARNLTRRGD